MCRKRILLITIGLILAGSPASYAWVYPPPEPPCPVIISTCPVEFDEADIGDCGAVVTETGCLILNGRSNIDGDGAHLVVDGGSVTVNARFDMGQGEDAFLTVRNGGSFTQQCPGEDCDDGLKLPDEEGGVHAIVIRNDGMVQCYSIELRPERDAAVLVGWGATLILDHALDEEDTERYNPEEWLEFGWLVPIDGVTIGDIHILWEGERAIVTTPPPCDPLKAISPSPADGEKGVASVVSDVILEWKAACGIGGYGRHYLFFSTDKDCVENAPPFTPGWEAPDCYVGYEPAETPTRNMGNQPIWTKFYWRVDQKHETGLMVVGDVWQFTTGCDPVPAGDVNLDCLVNLDDWALMLTTWGEEQFFPWD